MRSKMIKKQWQDQELDLLKNLYSQFSSKKWKNISLKFKQNGFQRSQTECRQKWVNFLNPSIKRTSWSDEQLEKLYDLYDKMGSRWCLIQKHIQRPQNSIKNRFYGAIRNLIRYVFRYFSITRAITARQINKTPPNILNDIFNSQNQFQFIKGQIKAAICDMKYKIDKPFLTIRIEENSMLYRKLYETMITIIQSQMKNRINNRQQIEQSDSFNYTDESLQKNNNNKIIKLQNLQQKEQQKKQQQVKNQQNLNLQKNIGYQTYFPFDITYQINPYNLYWWRN